MQIDESAIRREVLTELARMGLGRYIPVGISARHVHLTEADMTALFGEGYHLNPIRPLSQPGQFAAREQVTVVGPGGALEHVRVLGPVRTKSQVEISVSDSYKLGVKNCPVRLSGDLDGTIGVTLIGPEGRIQLTEGLIVAARHIHMNDRQAEIFGIHDKQIVSVRVSGDRPCLLDQVVCRTGSAHELELHLDTDEANACGLNSNELVELIIPGTDDISTTEKKWGQDMSNSERVNQKNSFSMSAIEPECDAGSRNADAAGLSDYRQGYRNSIPAEWREPTPAMKREYPIVAQANQQLDVSREEILELVTEPDIHNAIRDNRRQVYCEKKALITPAARECAEESGIQIVRVKED